MSGPVRAARRLSQNQELQLLKMVVRKLEEGLNIQGRALFQVCEALAKEPSRAHPGNILQKKTETGIVLPG